MKVVELKRFKQGEKSLFRSLKEQQEKVDIKDDFW